jgi:hypothetical protein
VRAAGLSGSVMGVLEAWLTRDPRPPVEIAVSWMWRMLLGPIGLAPGEVASGPSRPVAPPTARS